MAPEEYADPNCFARPEIQKLWSEEVSELLGQASRWLCWNRQAKLDRLGELLRIGSQFLEHYANPELDRTIVKNTLRDSEEIVQSMYNRGWRF